MQTSKTGVVLPVTSRSARVGVMVRPVDALGNWGTARLGSR